MSFISTTGFTSRTLNIPWTCRWGEFDFKPSTGSGNKMVQYHHFGWGILINFEIACILLPADKVHQRRFMAAMVKWLSHGFVVPVVRVQFPLAAPQNLQIWRLTWASEKNVFAVGYLRLKHFFLQLGVSHPNLEVLSYLRFSKQKNFRLFGSFFVLYGDCRFVFLYSLSLSKGRMRIASLRRAQAIKLYIFFIVFQQGVVNDRIQRLAELRNERLRHRAWRACSLQI